MAATWRLMVCPTEATDCSASLSGSASLTATSVMAEAMRRSSCARQTSSARNQKMTIGTRMATAAVSAEALPSRPDMPLEATWVEIKPKAKKPPMMNQTADAASAIRKGVRDGLCCSAKIKPPIEGTSSLAGVARRRCGGGPAGRLVRTNWRGGVGSGARTRRLGELQGRLRGDRLFGCLVACLGGSSRFGSTIPSRLRCSALSRSAREVRFGSSGPRSNPSPDFSSRDRVNASSGFCSLAPAAAASRLRLLLRHHAFLATDENS